MSYKNLNDKKKQLKRDNEKKRYYRLKKNNPKKFRERYNQKKFHTLKPKYVWNKYRLDAEDRNIKFSLKIIDFEKFNENKKCYYCGSRLDKVRLDRVDNKGGYEINNVVICCQGCNYMKGKLEKKMFVEQCKKVAGLHSGEVML